jgi:hypothetical protein
VLILSPLIGSCPSFWISVVLLMKLIGVCIGLGFMLGRTKAISSGKGVRAKEKVLILF